MQEGRKANNNQVKVGEKELVFQAMFPSMTLDVSIRCEQTRS